MKKVTVHASNTYDVLIQPGILPQVGQLAAEVLPKGKAAIITDDTVASLYLNTVEKSLTESGFAICTMIFPHGEDSKSHENLMAIYNFLIENEVTRSDFIVALGGGVVGDIAGYAAATYLRGIPFLQIPTTFLAAIDSSVGGKTAVNIPAGKNLIGAFHQPSLVVCDTDTFRTLPPEVFADGSAEMVKYGLILDEKLFSFLETGDIHSCIDDIVCRCVELKKQVVEQDEKDSGIRMILNFGHTLGHAIEKVTNHQVTHGHAVAIGMILVEQLGAKLGICPPELAGRIQKCLVRYSLPTGFQGELATLAEACLHDKKRAGDCIRLIFVSEPGKAIVKPIPVEEFQRILKEESRVTL